MSQENDLFPMESEESMSSQADSPARTLALRGTKKELKQNDQDSGQNSYVWLGRFSPDMPSLKTSQICLMENGEIGLSEFCGTFPKSGTMRNGNVYQQHQSAHITAETESGSSPIPGIVKFWPTPAAHEARLGYQDRSKGKKGSQESLTTVVINDLGGRQEAVGQLNPQFVEWMMGYPMEYTKDEQQLELKIEPPD